MKPNKHCSITIFSLIVIALPALLHGRDQMHASDAGEGGFVTIFDATTITGWKGDPLYWRVEEGCLVGEITPKTLLKRNTFLIWQNGQPADFELKLEYRISAEGNSGLNYRSSVVEDTPYALAGYQADVDGKNRYTGQNYEKRGRTILAFRGQKVVFPPAGGPPVSIPLSAFQAHVDCQQ